MSPNVTRKMSPNFIGQSGTPEQGGWLHKNMNSSTSPSRGRLRSNRFGDKTFLSTIFCDNFLSTFLSPKISAPPEKHISSQLSCQPELPVKMNQSSSKQNHLPRSPKPSHDKLPSENLKNFENSKNSENFDHTRERDVTSVTGFGGVEYKTKSRDESSSASLSDHSLVNVATERSKEPTSNEVTPVKTFVHHYSEVNDKL